MSGNKYVNRIAVNIGNAIGARLSNGITFTLFDQENKKMQYTQVNLHSLKLIKKWINL